MITVFQQMQKINQTYTNWTGTILYRRILKLRGVVKPTIVSNEYTVEIIYEADKDPRTYVIAPELKIHPGKDKLPHVWTDTGSLCLYWKEYNCNTEFLAESVIVWITWWLYYYEIWLHTGKWIARGTHPWMW